MGPVELSAKYRTGSVLVDTNLLVLLSVGLYKPDRISSFKRTDQYTLDDFTLVTRIIGSVERRVTTPHILAEVDNLTRQMPTREHKSVAAIMALLIEGQFEIYTPSRTAVRHEKYPILGLTDCATIAASEQALVLTDDFPLANILAHLGRDAVNINHLRTFDWR